MIAPDALDSGRGRKNRDCNGAATDERGPLMNADTAELLSGRR
jgi:hypothetical protein